MSFFYAPFVIFWKKLRARGLEKRNKLGVKGGEEDHENTVEGLRA